ncbi:MAG: hypothetical protein ACXAAP_13075 [Candidatus Thorarchaeota archaeon]
MAAPALRRKGVILVLVVMMVTSNLSMTTNTNLSRKTVCAFTLSDSTGPEFLLIGARFADLVPSNDPVNVTLGLSVVVRDPDGIDTVVGRYKNRSESIWKRVIMDLYGDAGNNTYLYFAKPLNFTLDKGHRLELWDVKYYANDTLGNWNYSELGSISYYLLPSRYQPDYSIVIVGAIGIVIIVAGALYMKRRSV